MGTRTMIFNETLPFAVDKTASVEQIQWNSNLASRPKDDTAPTTDCAPTRKRKAHKKSRRGCENCKLRRVKCDEARPKCERCISYGVDCSYDPTASGLKFAGESTFSVQKPVRTTLNAQQLVLTNMNLSSSPSTTSSFSSSCSPPSWISTPQSTPPATSNDFLASFKWLPSDLEIMFRFQDRTVLTVGTKSTAKMYQNEIFKLAINYPFLTHVVLTLTLLHDRHIGGETSIGERAAMHWLQGTALFQEGLIKPKQQSHKDALWATAALLGCIQFAAIEAKTPEEAWPLKPPSHDDLDWLKMSDGKRAVWKIADPTRPDSVFNKMTGHPDLYRPVVFNEGELKFITAEFCELYGLGPDSSSDTNVYYSAARMLGRMLHIACDNNTILEFLSFMAQIHPKLKKLIEQKEPKALLLVAIWYAKIYRYQWWIHRRGLMEGQAICIYLDRYYSHVKAIQPLLKYPKMAFGLSFAADHNPDTFWIRPTVVSPVESCQLQI